MATQNSILHPNCLEFAHISSDNRLYIHNLKSEKKISNDIYVSKPKLYVDKNHLTHNFKCYTWSYNCKESKANNKLSNNLFIVGYSDGMIIVWDLIRGVPAITINSNNDSLVPSSIVISHDEKSIFVSSTEINQITQFDLTSGSKIKSIKSGKKGTSLLAMHPSIDVLAVCSSSIKIIDIESGSKKKLDASFAGGVQSVKFTNCGRFLAAASHRSRELLIFDVRADAKSSAPIYVIPVKGLILAIDTVNNIQNHIDQIDFLCVFEDHQGATLIHVSADYIDNKINGINGIDQIDIVSNSPIITGRFTDKASNRNASNNIDIAFIIGSELNPSITYLNDVNNSDIIQTSSNENKDRFIVISHHPNHFNNQNTTTSINNSRKSINSSNNQASSLAAEISQDGSQFLPAPSVLGPHEMGGKKRPIVGDDLENSHKKSSSLNPSTTTTITTTASQPLSEEFTLEQRLEALSKHMNTLEEGSMIAHSSNSASGHSHSKGITVAGIAPPPTSDSLVTLIDQALQSGDDGLLEQCFSCESPIIIEATAQRLSTSKVVVFLKKLVAKFEKRPSRGILLTQWLSSVLRYHTAYLVTLPDLSFQLAGLSQMLEQRLSSYTKLSSLAGRLDLLMSQVNYRNNNNNNIDSTTMMINEIKPMNVYIEE